MAKMIKFNLTLSGATVSTFDELQDNFSAEILPIYRTGRLLKWLQARELTEQVQAVQAITPSDDDRELLGALCRALGLDDDAEVLTFLLEDWQVSQQRQTAAYAAPAAQTDTAQQSAEEAEQESDDTAVSAPAAEPVDWSGQDMSGRDFDGADFRNGIFKGTNFTNCTFKDCDFSNADLTEAKFNNASLKKVNFEKAILQGSEFTSTKFSECSFDHVELEDEFRIVSASFSSSSFKSATLKINASATFVDCNFTDAQMPNSSFWGEVSGCDFSNARLSSSTFKKSLSKCNFTNAELNLSAFDGEFHNGFFSQRSPVSECCFEKSNLSNSKFVNGAFECNFKNTNLTSSEFDWCAVKSNFSGANLQFSVFTQETRRTKRDSGFDAPICFTGANVMGIKGLTKEQAAEHTRIYTEWLKEEEEKKAAANALAEKDKLASDESAGGDDDGVVKTAVNVAAALASPTGFIAASVLKKIL